MKRGLGGGVIFLIYGCPTSKTVIMGPACTHKRLYKSSSLSASHNTLKHDMRAGAKQPVPHLHPVPSVGGRGKGPSPQHCWSFRWTQTQTEARVGPKKSHFKTLSTQISEATFRRDARWAEGHPGGHVSVRTVTGTGVRRGSGRPHGAKGKQSGINAFSVTMVT